MDDQTRTELEAAAFRRLVSHLRNRPEVQNIDMMICWMSEKPLIPNGKYAIKHTSRDARCIIKEVRYKMDINTLHRIEDDNSIKMNDIGRIKLRTTKPLFMDTYRRNRITGSFILVDEQTRCIQRNIKP